jgi:anti-anti-sigma factor
VTVIELCGELDMSTTHLITELIAYVAESSPSHVILDMTEVSFFCAAGLNALLQAQKTIKDAGGQFLLRNPSATTSSILTITGVAGIFQISTGTASNALKWVPDASRPRVPGEPRREQ